MLDGCNFPHFVLRNHTIALQWASKSSADMYLVIDTNHAYCSKIEFLLLAMTRGWLSV